MERNHKNNPISKKQGKDTTNQEQLQFEVPETPQTKEKMKDVLNPKFEGLDSPETINNHIEELLQGYDFSEFPVDAFPMAIQQIIRATNESLNYPIDFIGASILYAASVAIGNTHRIRIMTGYEQNAALYLAIVGRAGTNKSHPLSFALRPIEERDKLKYQEYKTKKLAYDTIASLSKKEREQQGFDEVAKPIWEQHLISDFTPEALTDVHKFNIRGIGVYCDELASWFKNFNRYSQGSEEQFWLSAWSGKPIRINRKTSEPTFIELPFISVAGTIQNAVLNELAKDNRTENGFLDRILFVIPENLKKNYWSEKELSTTIIDNWNTVMNILLNMPVQEDDTFNLQSIILEPNSEAKQLLRQWQKEMTDTSNSIENEKIVGIYAKLEQYVLRFSLIMELLQFACGKSNKQAIGVEAVQSAIKLIEYFKDAAIKVHTKLSNVNPLDKLPKDKRELYKQLPTNFTTSEGISIAESINIPERTFKRFLGNQELFIKIKRGEYKKCFLEKGSGTSDI